MKSYQRFKKFVLVFFAIWFLLSFSTGLYNRWGIAQNSLFPYYGWKLFWRVFPNHTGYGIEIYELDGKTFDPPKDYIKMFREQNRKLYSVPGNVIARFGRSIHRPKKDYSSAEQNRKSFEARFFREFVSVKYRLVYREYDPIDVWNNHRHQWPEPTLVLGEFEYQRNSVGQSDK